MSIFTRKTIHVPVEMGEVVYVNIPGLPTPARRVVTEIRVAENGIFITLTNRRTYEKSIVMASDADKKFFVDFKLAEAMLKKEVTTT